MKTIALGKSGIEVTRLCLGTWNLASASGWGPEDEAAAARLVHHALDNGCNFIDTAQGYGDSEEILGRALSGRRSEVVLATKLVHCPADKIEAAVTRSLERLQTDYIDLFICHWPSPVLPLAEFLGTLAREREAGRIRAIGVSNFNLEQMRVAAEFGVASLQPPFSLLWRFADEVFSYCRQESIAVMPYSPLAQGFLTGRYSRGGAAVATGPRRLNLLFSGDLYPQAVEVAKAVDRVADRLGCTSAQVALAWVLATPGVTAPVVGASSTAQWDQNVAALDVVLPEADYRELDAMGRAVWNQVDPEDSMWGWKPT